MEQGNVSVTDRNKALGELYDDHLRKYHAYIKASSEESRYPSKVEKAKQEWTTAYLKLMMAGTAQDIRSMLHARGDHRASLKKRR